MRVEIIRSVKALGELETDWVSLMGRCSYATPFQAFEWNYACCRWIENANDLFVVVVRDGPRLVGLAPLVRSRERFGATSLRFIGAGISDYLAFLLEVGQEDTILSAVISALRDNRRLWDRVVLQDLPGGGFDNTTLCTKASAEGFYTIQPNDTSICWSLRLPSSWEGYLSGLSKEMRSSMERKARRLRREHTFRVEDMAESTAWDWGLQVLFDLHQSNWIDKGKPGAFAQGRIRQFHRQVVATFRTKEQVSLLVIFADDRPVAAIYLFSMGDTVYYYLSGCRTDQPWSRYSVGTQVLREAIRGAIKAGATTFDFMRGSTSYKERLGGRPIANVNMTWFHSRSMYLAYQSLRTIKAGVPESLKRSVKKLR